MQDTEYFKFNQDILKKNALLIYEYEKWSITINSVHPRDHIETETLSTFISKLYNVGDPGQRSPKCGITDVLH